jgi:hypothetical protein
MGLLTFGLNVTLDGCLDHEEGIAIDEYVVSSVRTHFPSTNSHHIVGDLRTRVEKLKDATPPGALLG